MKIGGRLGVNWYLTRPENVDPVGNKDGEKRHHIGVKRWRGWEYDLLGKLSSLSLLSDRRIERIGQLEILPPDTLFVGEQVPVEGRALWHERAGKRVSEASIVFLDPDNGFEVPSMSRRRAPKYAFYSEAADYLRMGKIVVSIQFARQCDPITRGQAVRLRLMEVSNLHDAVPIIRARMAPNLLFIAQAPALIKAQLTLAIESFAQNREKIDLIY
jgi:hypothetical protein